MMNQTPIMNQETADTSLNSFPLYAVARLVVQAYRPYLDPVGLTYPQYLIIQALSDSDGLSVTQIADKLLLDAGTITPILKRLQTRGVVLRERSKKDERSVINHLSGEGRVLAHDTRSISELALNRGLMRSHQIKPLLDHAEYMLKQLTTVHPGL